MKKLFFLLVLIAIPLSLSGCLGQNISPDTNLNLNSEKSSVNLPTNANAKTFTLSANNFSYDLKEIRVKRGDQVEIILKNTEGFHDLKIDEFNVATPKLNAGQEATIKFTADSAGIFEYYCSVGNHRQMGMVGKLIVE